MDFWTKVAFFLLMGYSLFSRAFAYIGIPPLKIFIGEAALAAFICFKPRAIFDGWLDALTRGGSMAAFAWILLLSLIYGCFEAIYGLLSGYKAVTAFETPSGGSPGWPFDRRGKRIPIMGQHKIAAANRRGERFLR
ncbi:MAG: hypothetical protein WAM39_27005 [Bryobacteraceae bacterium]